MIVAGIDEAGRGPAVGPMVMAVAVAEKDVEDTLSKMGVKDSKLLTPKMRSSQFNNLKSVLLEYSSTHVQANEIDELRNRISLNEIEAMGMGELLNNLKTKPDIVFIDCPDVVPESFVGRLKKYLSFNPVLRVEHKADLNYPIVAAASIIAKVERDAAILELEKEYGKIGSGYSHDPDTIAFIKDYLLKNKCLPECARRSWLTTQRILDEKFQTKLFGGKDEY